MQCAFVYQRIAALSNFLLDLQVGVVNFTERNK